MGLGVAYGETTGVPVETAPLEKTPDLSPMDMPVLQVADASYRTVELGQGVVGLINQSIVGKDWERLKQLLDEYPSSEYDPILYRYALGAWYRSQFKHAQAIELYRQILTDNPEFHYVRFDLAVMLFENKQYQEAKAMLLKVKPSLNANMQALANHYVRQINKRKQARVDISGNYEKTDNVNNAGSATQIQWQGRTWQNPPKVCPKKPKACVMAWTYKKTCRLMIIIM